VLVTGPELSLFTPGFFIGDDCFARIDALVGGAPEAVATVAEVPAKLDPLLADIAVEVRTRFCRKLSYASGIGD